MQRSLEVFKMRVCVLASELIHMHTHFTAYTEIFSSACAKCIIDGQSEPQSLWLQTAEIKALEAGKR